MFERLATVASEIGLHARPAALVARAARTAKSPVYLKLGEETVEITSGIMVMTLGAQCGDRVVVMSHDEDAADQIAALIQTPIRPL